MPPLRRLLGMLAASMAVMASTAAEAGADPVIAAAGDIACDPENPEQGTGDFCRHKETSDLLVGAGLSAVLPLGDIQYRSSGACCSYFEKLMAVYDPTWGRVKSISRPVIGNHEGTWTGYFDYFNGMGALDGPAGPRGKGYYSFDVGSWHLIALNSNCDKLDCAEEERWLRADLAAHPTGCTLAYWHHPRYSSGHDGDNATLLGYVQPFWQALYDAQAEVVLSGHSHDYERFAPLSADGAVNQERGIRQFVVGTGGAYFTGGLGTLIPNSEVSQNDDFGVLKLTLHQASYDWRFVPIAGKTFSDSGSGSCHGPSPPVPVVPAPSPPPGAAVDRTAPVISSLSLSRRRFSVRPKGRGTTFRYTLSEIAAVRFRIKRRGAGGRYRSVGTFTDQGVAGRNRRRFRGRLDGRRLRPGAYRAGLVALDYVGNRSRAKRIRFRVVRR